ncbi:MAG: ABC transporter permease [Bacteroidota bacterium]
MFQNNIRIAWRNLFKNKVTGFINVAGLAIGMAVTLMIGLWLRDELTYDQYHQNYDRLVQVLINQEFNDQIGTSPAMSLPVGPGLRNNFGSDFEEVIMASWNSTHLFAIGDKKLNQRGMYVESAFPEMLTLEMIAGDREQVLRDQNSILLNRSMAEALFGSTDVVGQILKMDTEHDLRISGVFEDLPNNCTLRNASYFIPWAHYVANNEWLQNSTDNWGNHSWQCFAQLTAGADLASVNTRIADMEAQHNTEGKPELFLFPMSKWHLYSRFDEGINVGGRIQYVRLFGIIGVFVLLLACINFMNLSTARSEKRAKEVGVRKTIGSLRSQLIGQFLSESLLVTSLALVISIALVQISLGAFNNLADKAVSIPWSNPIFWSLVLGFALFTGLLAGSYPAFYLSSFDPLKVLKGTFRAGRKARLPRQVLVTLQFTVSVALIIGTIVVFQQIDHARNRPVGYDRESIVSIPVSPELSDKLETFRNETLATGVAEEVAFSNAPVTAVYSNQIGFDWEGKDPNTQPLFSITSCSWEYGKAVGWEVIQGRDFDRELKIDSSAMIINEAAYELIGVEDIVGKTIRQGDIEDGTYVVEDTRTVVGVVKNLIMESPWDPVRPAMFLMEPTWSNYLLVRFRQGQPVQDGIAAVEKIYQTLSPSSPFEFDFVDDKYNQKFRSEERIGHLARIFAILAIFISCLGLFGLSTYVAEQRTKEIGIRKVLGASVSNLWAMQSKSFVVLVLLSCLIAVPIAWYYLDGWLDSYEYRVDLSWTVFVLSAILALAVTLLTVSYQSIRAAMANPVNSLRSE